MHTNIFAYTAPGAIYPEYLSINRRQDEDVTITVRGPAQRTEDYPICSVSVMMTLPADQIGALIAALQEFEDQVCNPILPAAE